MVMWGGSAMVLVLLLSLVAGKVGCSLKLPHGLGIKEYKLSPNI